jgi:pimeloyl-ACP methyl ester carboxylesterase
MIPRSGGLSPPGRDDGADTHSTRHSTARLEVLGRRLEYRWIGPRPHEAPTIVFLHEALGSVSTWRDFPARLAAGTGCGALVYSRTGHGGSGALSGLRSVRYLHEEALDVLPAVLAHFALSEVVLFGHSDGASIAILLAGARLGAVRGVILEAPHVFVEEAALAGIRRTTEAYETTSLRERLSRHHGEGTDALFCAWAEIWRRPGFRGWNIEEYLPSVTCPVLVIQGEDDPYGTLRQVDAVVSQVRGTARPLVLPKCGHSPHSERPDEVLDAVAGFVWQTFDMGC